VEDWNSCSLACPFPGSTTLAGREGPQELLSGEHMPGSSSRIWGTARAAQLEAHAGEQWFNGVVKGIVSRDFGVLFLFIWIDMKFLIGPDQVYFSF
jgi:hypothetical protein